jgi:predicted amidohydrolase
LVPHPAGRSLDVVCLSISGGPDSLAAAVADAVGRVDGPTVVVLPERAGGAGSDVVDPAATAEADGRLVAELSAALSGTGSLAVLTIVELTRDGPAHVGVGVAAGGSVLHQPALHPSPATPWATVLGDRQKVLPRPASAGPVELALVVGDDVLVPEAARLAVLGGSEVLLAPWHDLGDPARRAVLVARAVENGVAVVAAARDGILVVDGRGVELAAPAGHPVTVPVG